MRRKTKDVPRGTPGENPNVLKIGILAMVERYVEPRAALYGAKAYIEGVDEKTGHIKLDARGVAKVVLQLGDYTRRLELRMLTSADYVSQKTFAALEDMRKQILEAQAGVTVG